MWKCLILIIKPVLGTVHKRDMINFLMLSFEFVLIKAFLSLNFLTCMSLANIELIFPKEEGPNSPTFHL